MPNTSHAPRYLRAPRQARPVLETEDDIEGVATIVDRLFDVVDPTTAELRVRSQTCNDFSHDVVRHLALLGLSAQPLVPNRKCRTILYSSAPLVSVPDTDPELVRYWSGISTIARQTESAHSLLAAALLVDELALRRTAFVRVDGRNLRVALEAPFARWAYEEAANGDAKPGNWSWS